MDWLTLKKMSEKLGHNLLAAAYVSTPEASVIVSPRGQGGSASYECGDPVRLSLTAAPDEIGQAVMKALAEFSTESRDLRSTKTSEWKSYAASRLKSVRSFEERYTRIGVDFQVNGLLVLEANVARDSSLGVRSYVTAAEIEIKIGQQLLQVNEAVVTLKSNGIW